MEPTTTPNNDGQQADATSTDAGNPTAPQGDTQAAPQQPEQNPAQ